MLSVTLPVYICSDYYYDEGQHDDEDPLGLVHQARTAERTSISLGGAMGNPVTLPACGASAEPRQNSFSTCWVLPVGVFLHGPPAVSFTYYAKLLQQPNQAYWPAPLATTTTPLSVCLS